MCWGGDSLNRLMFIKDFDSLKKTKTAIDINIYINININFGVQSIPPNLSRQNPTCQVTSTQSFMKERERHIQSTRTHFKTGQAILQEGLPPLSRGNMCHQRPCLEMVNIRQNKPQSTLLLINHFIRGFTIKFNPMSMKPGNI